MKTLDSSKDFWGWLRTIGFPEQRVVTARIAARLFPFMGNERIRGGDLIGLRAMLCGFVAGVDPSLSAIKPIRASGTSAAQLSVALRSPEATASMAAAGYAADFASMLGGVYELDSEAIDLDVECLQSGASAFELSEMPLWISSGGVDLATRMNRFPFDVLQEPEWDFWRRWYRGFLLGKPLDWEIQRRVAQIGNDIWLQGVEQVAKKIEEIEAQFLSEKTPLAERIDLNPETGRFFATPIPIQNPSFISVLMGRTADALDDALQGRNGLREDMREVRVLRRTHERYSNDPQRVEMDYTSVAVSLRRNLDVKELADTGDNLALLEAVEDGVRGLRAHHPEIAANRETLAKQALKELPQADIALLEDAAEVLPQITEGVMQEDFQRDIPRLINDATLPVPSGAPPLPGADETTRIFGRVSRMAIIYQAATDKGAAAFDSKGVKTVRLGMTVLGLIRGLVRLGLQLFGVIS